MIVRGGGPQGYKDSDPGHTFLFNLRCVVLAPHHYNRGMRHSAYKEKGASAHDEMNLLLHAIKEFHMATIEYAYKCKTVRFNGHEVRETGIQGH